jgi:hypothetical protein
MYYHQSGYFAVILHIDDKFVWLMMVDRGPGYMVFEGPQHVGTALVRGESERGSSLHVISVMNMPDSTSAYCRPVL